MLVDKAKIGTSKPATTGSIFKTLGVPTTSPKSGAGLLAFKDEDILEELKKRGLKVENISESSSSMEEVPSQESVPSTGIN